MRILLASHFPPEDSPRPALIGSEFIQGLEAAGHEVRALFVDSVRGAKRLGGAALVRVTCRRGDPGADLPFDIPYFATHPGQCRRFAELSDDETAAYREVLRRAVDAQTGQFDPHVMHCDHVWLLAHLALESGVPYVISAYADELAECDLDARFRQTVTEAAENAGRIIVPDDALRRRLRALVGEATSGEIDGRIALAPWNASGRLSDDTQKRVAWFAVLYAQVLAERLDRS